ncbi:MAG TPA: NADP-dependent oxidoreductase [Methanomassiliicoccales archaeon]|nr:NADP-dependent oxidoreductase [Methanomassiliicoccales archaeon]
MRAVVIERFGGPEVLKIKEIAVPTPGRGDVLIRVDSAGVGEWDPWLRDGGMGGKLPMILGTDGAGRVVAVGATVKGFKVGDLVYGYALDAPKGGFYAEYAAIPQGCVALRPKTVDRYEAGALAASAVTALIGLEKLKLRKGDSLAILGASGGVGHVALQLAKRMGARVFAVASKEDGVELVRSLGADESVDGRSSGLIKATRSFAPDGFDHVIAFANSSALKPLMAHVRKGGGIAYPWGVEPEPQGSKGVKVSVYNGVPERKLYDRLDELMGKGRFRVAIGGEYSLEDIQQAHKDVLKHHIGKLLLTIHRS